MARTSLRRFLVVWVGLCMVATFVGCEASNPPSTIDLTSPIKTPADPTTQKVELKPARK